MSGLNAALSLIVVHGDELDTVIGFNQETA